MSSTFTTAKLLEKQGTGDNSGTWGVVLNAVLDDVDQITAGMLSLSVAGSSNVTLTDDQAQNAIIKLTGALTGNIEVRPPARTSNYRVWNATSGSFTLTFKTASGTGVLIPQNEKIDVFCDGTNVERPAPWAGVADVSGTTTLTATYPIGYSTYVTGMRFLLKMGSTITGQATLNINSLGAKNVVSREGFRLNAGALVAGRYYEFMYDGTNMVLLNAAGRILLWEQSASASASILFSGIDGSYPVYEIDISGCRPTTVDDSLLMRIGIAAAIQTGASYSGNYQTNSNGVLTGSYSAAFTSFPISSAADNAAPKVIAGQIRIIDPAGTTFHKPVRSSISSVSSSGSQNDRVGEGHYLSASAITDFQFLPSTGASTIAAGTFRLYGVPAG